MLTYSQQRQAVGCTVDIVLVSDLDATIVEDIFRQLWLCIFMFERRCSRFLPESELIQCNRAAGNKHPVSPEFREVLVAARDMARRTAGAFNPFILPALQRAGYQRSMVQAYSGDQPVNFTERTVVPYDRLEIGKDWVRMPYGTALDLGGCGKGYLGDELAHLVQDQPGISGFWASLGGDVVTYGSDAEGNPWTIHIENLTVPSPGTQYAAKLTVPDDGCYAVATSAVTKRRGIHNGKAWHHLIDVRTGQPAETDLAAASVYASSGLVADVLASCVVIDGSAKAGTYLAEPDVFDIVLQPLNAIPTTIGQQKDVVLC